MQATDDQSLKAPPVARAALSGLPPWQAPRQGTEARLAGFFTRELNLDTVGADDDFFALGGTSLQAAAIFSAIRSELGARLPLATLYRAPTIRQLAVAVDKAADKSGAGKATSRDAAAAVALDAAHEASASRSDDHRCVQLIQAGSSRHALFIAPGIGGDIVGLGHVVRHLDPAQSVYGLRSIGLQEGEEPLADMPAIAAAFVAEIRRVQPAGPYQLFGVCWGTLVCLEIARQLEAAGEKVSLLALLDPPPVGGGGAPGATTTAPSKRQFLRQRLALYGKALSATPLHDWPAYLWGRAVNVADALRKRDPFRGDASEYLRWRVREANLRAMRAYEPPPFGGDACLLFTQDRADGRSKAARDYWIQHVRAQGREQYVPGKDSGDALAPERAADVAARLSGCLARPFPGPQAGVPAGGPTAMPSQRPAATGG